MKNEKNALAGVRGTDRDGASEHEKHRRIKDEQDRILRKQLCRLRDAETDEIDHAPSRRR